MKCNSCLAVFVLLLSLTARGQQLQLTGLDGKSVSVSAADKAMTRHTVPVVNHHTHAKETYGGVLLADLLAKVGAPLGEKLRGPTMIAYVKVGASDNYHALLALAEVDPDTHPNETIVADTMNGKALDAKEGSFKLIVPGDKRPARSVRMVTTIELKQAP